MSNSNKKIHLDDLINKSRKIYEKFDKSKGSSRLDFGSIYLTRPSEKGISNIVTIIDILKDDDQSNNKYVNVAPISLDIEMAADDDLILEGVENNGPLPCDITIHAGMQMTISIDDISSYYAHLSKKHEKKLKKLLLLLEGDYSIDVETLSIGSPIISPKDYRVEYRNNLVRDLEYLTIPAFISVSNYINEQKSEPYEDYNNYFKNYIYVYNSFHLLQTEKKYSGDSLARMLNEKSLDRELKKIIHENEKKGIKTIIPSKPDGPDLIIEDENGEKKEIEINNNKYEYIDLFPIEQIKIYPFQRRVNTNTKIYNFIKQNIAKWGIHEPLQISYDNFCIDGTRRIAMARDLGMDFVPVIKWPDFKNEMIIIKNSIFTDHLNQIKKINKSIRDGNIDKSFKIIDKWENKIIPESDYMNPYRAIIEWIPYYATANIDGLQKVNESLNKLADKKLNHIDVDNSILITNGRILQLDGKHDQAIKKYEQINTKEFMKNSIFTDPLIDCYSKLGDNVTATRIANKNLTLVKNRYKFATQTYELTGENQPWMTENISASGVAGIISA